MAKSTADLVAKRRAALRQAGLRYSDLGAGHKERRLRPRMSASVRTAAQADRSDPELSEFLDAALMDIFDHSDSP